MGWLAGGLPPAARLALTAVEAALLALVGGGLVAGWARDTRAVLRGALLPAPEPLSRTRVVH